MANLREVTVLSSLQSVPVRFMTSAETFGALKAEFGNNNVSYNEDLKVALKVATGTTSVMDSTILPVESFILMMTPKKVKSGRTI